MMNKLKPPNIFGNQPAKHKTRDKVLTTFTWSTWSELFLEIPFSSNDLLR